MGSPFNCEDCDFEFDGAIDAGPRWVLIPCLVHVYAGEMLAMLKRLVAHHGESNTCLNCKDAESLIAAIESGKPNTSPIGPGSSSPVGVARSHVPGPQSSEEARKQT